MSRKPRLWVPDLPYHVTSRGNRREALFREEEDFMTFLLILKKVHSKIPFEVFAYCLMTNHYHLLLRSSTVPIYKIMQLINKKYANYFNNKYSLTGHVFEKRYFDKMIPDIAGMLKVSSYIHLNPVEANIVANPEDYRWSSYPYFHGAKQNFSFMNIDELLKGFNGTQKEKLELYRLYVTSDRYRPKIVELK